ncbi:RNA-binding protein 4F [Aphomia sociella]
MAIVEDEVRNESEDENEIEVVVEEDDAEQDSDDSDDEDDEGVLERKVAELESRIAEDPYNYDEHIELIQSLWALTELDKWRSAFERLQQMTALRAEHWLLWLQTEASLAHTWQSRERIAELFKQAALDCYSIPILSEWCTWAMGVGEVPAAREQLDEVLRRAGADPFSGKLFWDAKLELEKSQLDTMSEDDSEYKTQQERVLWCLEETVSRPLLRGEEAWPQLEELGAVLHDQAYVDKVKKQHEAAVDYLHKVTPFEDRLLTTENPEEKYKIYQEYIETVKDLSQRDEYAECDSNGILKVVYERASTECAQAVGALSALLSAYARLARRSSRSTQARVLDACVRRCPRAHSFWTLKMQQAELDGKSFDEVKAIFETALSKGMESYKEAEALWLSYLEYIRRRTAFDNEADVDTLRRTFRLAWDSLAEAWGEEANDCEVPLYWARLEYKRMNDPKQGKEIFEEIFKYGTNKSMSKYWEALLQLELCRTGANANKLRALLRRALRCVSDYPPAAARLWTDYERDHGELAARADCADMCEAKLKEWRDNYQAMKEKMTGKKQNTKQDNKKTKVDNKKKKREDDKPNRKRKAGEENKTNEAKKKKDDTMDVEEKEQDGESSGVKRSHEHDDEENDVTDNKRQRTDDESSDRVASRDACTLFVSNLDFKVDEKNLRDKLSEYGDIVSLRVRAGVKAFGGSICYCQYKTSEAVERAIKDDRTPLDGRPMFLSRYSANKTKPSFKYATTVEKNKLFVKNLPFGHCTKEALTDVFEKYGKLEDIRIVTFKDGKPKGLAYIEYSDEAAAQAAVVGCASLELAGRRVDVALSAPPPRGPAAPAVALGQPKRDAGEACKRRTQLSSFIPSVLQKPSTSKATNGDHANGEKRPLSNSDFRSMLLNK